MILGHIFSPVAFPVVFAAAWVWAISTIIAVMLIGAIFILKRAASRAEIPHEEEEAGGLGLLGISKPKAAPEAAVPLEPVVQMPAATTPEPEPLIPVEIIPHVASAALPDTSEITGEHEKVITDELPALDVAAVSQESLIAQQIAQQIAERRARLSALEDRGITHLVAPAQPTGALERPAPESETVEVSNTTERLDSRTSPLPPKPVLTEQLPPSNRKLKPPAPTREIPHAAPRVAVAAPVAPVAMAPAARVETGDVSDVLIPVEQFPRVTTPLTDAIGPRNYNHVEAKVPTFLAEDGGLENIGYERKRLFLGMFVVLVLFGVLYTIFNAQVNKLPAAVAERLAVIPRALGFEQLPPPPLPPKLVQIQEYDAYYTPSDKKDVRTVTISGLVKNTSSIKLDDLRAEIEVIPRQPDAPPELRTIFLNPKSLEPNREATYKLELTDEKVMRTVLRRIVFIEKDANGKETVKEIKAERKPGTVRSPEAPPEDDKKKKGGAAQSGAADKRMQKAFPQPTDRESRPFKR